VHLKFDQILKFAHANYDQKKIKFSEIDSLKEKQKNRKSASHSLSYRNIRRHITRHRDIPPRKFCPHCKNALLRPTQLKIHQIYIDLIRTKNGMRKSVTKYTSTKGWCTECGYHYRPEKMRTFGRPHLYGHGFKSWIVYQRVGLRMPYKAILEIIDEQFNYRLSVGSISHFIREFGEYYTKLGQTMLKIILTSPYIHVDETSINLRGIKNYIWVFTNGKYVVFKHAETRESAIVHELLDQYKGVLISDFYPGFDSLLCRQQKCWVHLIRDLNDDLWRSPFDVQYETFIAEVRDIIVPIMKAIQRYGLKSWHLNKFRKSVDQFYAKVIENRYYKSELVSKYQKRFQRYRENLFVFLEQDGIPWHNNVAENALRHITIQEKISGFYFKTLIEEYVLMLGIRQTCRFYGKSFYKFLYSKETSVDYFN
jgi:transposase